MKPETSSLNANNILFNWLRPDNSVRSFPSTLDA